MSLGVFILPKGALCDEIMYWKGKIKNELSNQPYNSHPPHMTLSNVELINDQDGIEALSNMKTGINPFTLSISSKEVFWNDTFTNGHTLYYRVKINIILMKLQKLIAETLVPFVSKSPAPKLLKGEKLLLESYNRYGFAFVGGHWIPHFSVASLITQKNHNIISQFLLNMDRHEFTVDELTLWRVKGDEHIYLKTISF